VTEAAITSLVHAVPDRAGPEEADVIGRPLPNVTAHVLDELGAPQPVGVPGELFLGGAGLASSYRRDAAGTAAAFGAFASWSNERLYRTGDRVVRRGDGALRFLGRLDEQVKIRGVRVEPEEVAARLRAHPDVRDAVVQVRGGALAAWIVPAAGATPTAAALRTYLAHWLPAAARPATFTALPALPRTVRAKLDPAALPAPAAPEPTRKDAPQSATEAVVAALWRELLGRHEVGRDENFFDLGGHSLLLIRAHARLAPRAPQLTIVELFRYPTVRALAAFLDSR
jgi:acyl-coenzyme A synthetase/AMP-(fatty) acid ligase